MEDGQEERDLHGLVLTELKKLGVKVPRIKKLKPNIQKQDKGSSQNVHKVFGASLSDQEWITDSDSDCPLPKFVAAATGYLKTYIGKEVGLFRKAGSVVRQRELRTKLEEGGNFFNCEPNDTASLLKQWLRELPEPVIPVYLHDLFLRCQCLDCDEDRLNAILMACLLLPPEHLYTLKHLLKFLHDIAANSDVNKMSIYNLSLIMAPNLLPNVGNNNNVNKSNNIVQSCTSLIEMLIANADKVGSIPQKISDQLSSEEGSDFPIETLDCSPLKMKRKLKNAVTGVNVVADLVCGIKKMVGGNVTPMSSCLEIPDIHAMKSSSRRKNKGNTSETPFFTPVAKMSRLTVPLNGTNSNTPLSHFRRKSFGLLNKKHRKRAKSGMKQGNAVHSSNTPSTPSVVVLNTVILNKKESEKYQRRAPTVSLDTKDLPNDSIVQNTSIKRAVSDCPLSGNKMNRRKRCSNSLSTGHLPAKRLSPMNVNRKLSGLKKISSSDLVAELFEQHTQKKKDNCPEIVGQKIENVIPDMKRNSSLRRSARTSNRRLSSGENARTKASYDHLGAQKKLSQSGSRRRSSSSSRNARKNSNREDTKQKACLSVADMLPNTPLKSEENYEKNTSTPISVQKQPLLGSFKRNLNKSSLKRGRPNTIKTGLPSELCPKYSNDLSCSKLENSITFVESKKVYETVTKTTDYGEASDAIVHTPDVLESSISDVYVSISSKDDSSSGLLSYDFFTPESLPASIEKKDKKMKDLSSESIGEVKLVMPDMKSPICINEVPKLTSMGASSERKTKRVHKKVSENASDSYSQCPADRTNSDNIVKSMDFSECLGDLYDKENLYPGREIWHSDAENFLNAHVVPKETNCKRESIIQIMANNAGKVKESVHHYNQIATDKHHGDFKSVLNKSNSLSRSTPRREVKRTHTGISSISPDFYNTRSLASLRMYDRSYSQSSTVTRSNSKPKKMAKSPLPPPPKFVVSSIEKSTPSTPLKEVTNVKSETKKSSTNSKITQASKNLLNIEKVTPLSEGSKLSGSSPSFQKDSVVKRFKQISKLSSEGDIRFMITKQSRSESSPTLAKKGHSYSLRLKESSQSPLLRKRFHSQSFISPDLLSTRTTSTVSIRDINDLKNINLVDAWECKM